MLRAREAAVEFVVIKLHAKDAHVDRVTITRKKCPKISLWNLG